MHHDGAGEVNLSGEFVQRTVGEPFNRTVRIEKLFLGNSTWQDQGGSQPV